MKVVSAVTTCARDGVDYLPDTLKSLRDAGFDPRTVTDSERRGSWPTLREALRRLLLTSGEALCVFQDDVLIAKDCRQWLDSQLWPGPLEEVGVVSLYTASTSHLRSGWFHMDELSVYRPFGACALVFPRHAAERLLADPTNSGFMSGSDTSVATFCRREKLRWWMFSPSLMEHVGQRSAIGPKEIGLTPERTAGNWISDVALLKPAHRPVG